MNADPDCRHAVQTPEGGTATADSPPLDAQTDHALPLAVAANQLARVLRELERLDWQVLAGSRDHESSVTHPSVAASLEQIEAALAAIGRLMTVDGKSPGAEGATTVPRRRTDADGARTAAAADTDGAETDDDEGTLYRRRKPGAAAED
jgi:hypothetical protein